jgi:hypothetical protein
VVGGLVAIGAVIAILASTGGSRSGTLTDYTGTCAATTGASGATGPTTTAAPTTSTISRITGAGAAALNKALLGTNLIPTGDFSFAPGFVVNSMVVNSTSAPYSGTAVVTVGSRLQLSMSMSVTDCKNFALNVATTASSSTGIGSGLTLDPSTFTGSITEVNGTATWALTGASKAWTLATGATLTTTPTIANSCPTGLTCPVHGPRYVFVSTNGTLAITGLPSLNVIGAELSGTQWALLQTTTSNPTALSFSIGSSSVAINSPTLTIWHSLTHQSNPNASNSNLVMPDLSSITNGLNVEFCGTFQIATPITGDQATGGCAEWSPQGIVLAQTKNLSATSATANSSASVNTNVKGVAWTNLPSSYTGKGGIATVSFSGVPTPTFPSTISMGGVSTLPGVVMAALGKPAVPFNFNVSGQFSVTGFTVTGSVPVNLTISNEPLGITVQSLDGTIAWSTSGGGSLTIGTQSQLTLGYSPSTSTATSSVALQISPQGIALTLTALGTPVAGDTTDGLTPATRLAHPSQAQYLSTQWMGIKGLNLWSLTGSIGWGSDGLPTLAYSTSAYVDPSGATTKNVIACSGTCDDSDWMISTALVNADLANPCFAYAFDGTSGTATLSLSGGVMKTSVFELGAAPLGCTVGGVTLPAGFAGLQFASTFGGTSVNVAMQVSSAGGFQFSTHFDNLTIAGITYSNLSLQVSLTDTASLVAFDAVWTIPGVGASTVHADTTIDAQGFAANLSATVPNFQTGIVGTFAISNFAFNGVIELGGTCGSMTASGSGGVSIHGGTALSLDHFAATLTCTGVQSLYFDALFTHKGGAFTMTFSFDKVAQALNAAMGWNETVGGNGHNVSLGATMNLAIAWGTNAPSGDFSASAGLYVGGGKTCGKQSWWIDGGFSGSVAWGASGDFNFNGGLTWHTRVCTSTHSGGFNVSI